MLKYLLIQLLCGCICVFGGLKVRGRGHEVDNFLLFFTFELIILGDQLLKFYLAKITLSHITLNDLVLKLKP